MVGKRNISPQTGKSPLPKTYPHNKKERVTSLFCVVCDEDGVGGVMLKRGVLRSLRELNRSISPQSMYTPREILRVKSRPLVLRPFLRMTRGLVPLVCEIRSLRYFALRARAALRRK